MSVGNVQSSQGVTLVGAGQPRAGDIAVLRERAPTLVAADGGAEFCLSAGLAPVAVIGDFDSLDPAAMRALDGVRLIRVAEQETTDFEKSLSRIEAPFVLATGFTGGRIDHALAVWSVLARRVGPPALVLGPEDVVFAAARSVRLDVAPGTRVSLFPMAPVRGTSTGLAWPIDGLTLDPMGRIGTSNRATGPVGLEFETPGCLVIMPRAELAAAIRAMTG